MSSWDPGVVMFVGVPYILAHIESIEGHEPDDAIAVIRDEEAVKLKKMRSRLRKVRDADDTPTDKKAQAASALKDLPVSLVQSNAIVVGPRSVEGPILDLHLPVIMFDGSGNPFVVGVYRADVTMSNMLVHRAYVSFEGKARAYVGDLEVDQIDELGRWVSGLRTMLTGAKEATAAIVRIGGKSLHGGEREEESSKKKKTSKSKSSSKSKYRSYLSDDDEEEDDDLNKEKVIDILREIDDFDVRSKWWARVRVLPQYKKVRERLSNEVLVPLYLQMKKSGAVNEEKFWDRAGKIGLKKGLLAGACNAKDGEPIEFENKVVGGTTIPSFCSQIGSCKLAEVKGNGHCKHENTEPK